MTLSRPVDLREVRYSITFIRGLRPLTMVGLGALMAFRGSPIVIGTENGKESCCTCIAR